ncbi:MAG: type II secretion system protein [Desulfococcaceae bacterium]
MQAFLRNPGAGRRFREAGFTYLAVLVLVMVMGIALSGTGRYWSTTMKREREAELLFRGDRIRRAIEAYHRFGGWPKDLEELVEDRRAPVVRRFLRKIYRDPMAEDGNWVLVKGRGGGIHGVHSAGDDVPLKTGNFPPGYEQFESAETYADWRFVAGRNAAPAKPPPAEPENEEAF